MHNQCQRLSYKISYVHKSTWSLLNVRQDLVFRQATGVVGRMKRDRPKTMLDAC